MFAMGLGDLDSPKYGLMLCHPFKFQLPYLIDEEADIQEGEGFGQEVLA